MLHMTPGDLASSHADLRYPRHFQPLALAARRDAPQQVSLAYDNVSRPARHNIEQRHPFAISVNNNASRVLSNVQVT